MTAGRDVFTGCPMLSPELRAEVSRLGAALPGYEVIVTRRARRYRFEAVRRRGGPRDGPWCVISSDAADLWRELAPWARVGAGIGARPAPAP